MNNGVLLVFPKAMDNDKPKRPPLGILTVAAGLTHKGIPVTVLDEAVEDDFDNKLLNELKKNPVCVGISSMSGPHIANSLRISKFVKDNFDTPIVWGGVHASLEPKATIVHDLVDIIVRDDGEETFPVLVDYLKNRNNNLEDIQGIGFKRNGNIIITEPAPPADVEKLSVIPFNLIDFSKYAPGRWQFDLGKDDDRIKTRADRCIIPMETSRGCPFSCSFCTESVRKKKWRALSAERVVADIKHYVNEYGIKNFTFIDDNMFGNVKRGEKIIDLLLEEDLDIRWYTNIRADFLIRAGSEFIGKLYKAGCRCITFGAESGAERILQMINKKSTADKILDINKKLSGSGITPSYVAIKGFPTETREELLQTYNLAVQLMIDNKSSMCSLPSLIPTPGTKMGEQCLGKKVYDYTLEDWSKKWIAFQDKKPEWVLDETFDFINKYRYVVDIMAGISWRRGKIPKSKRNYFFESLLLKFCRFNLKVPLMEKTGMYKLWKIVLHFRYLITKPGKGK